MHVSAWCVYVSVYMSVQFDNILMEEAAQILEIETFIPLLLQVSAQHTLHPVYITQTSTRSTSHRPPPCLHHTLLHPVHITQTSIWSTSHTLHPVYITQTSTRSTSHRPSPGLHHTDLHPVYITQTSTRSTSHRPPPGLPHNYDTSKPF